MGKKKRRCIMGCKLVKGHKLHLFPQDAKRRAEWCRIMGINIKNKRNYLCGAHFPDYYIQGGRVSKFAIPNPPELAKLVNDIPTSYDESSTEEIEKDFLELSDDDDRFSAEENQEEDKSEEEVHKNKIEDFEIRKGQSNDMIIKGRFIQTDNYLMVSYTPPTKWYLQNRVKLLDEQCTQQLQQIKDMNDQNSLLRTELKKYKKLFPKLKVLQRQNRFLHARLKMYEFEEKSAGKRKVKEILIKDEYIKSDPNTPDS